MKPSDYRCPDCGAMREITVRFKDSFPASVPCLRCGSFAKRVYAFSGCIIHQGKAGNSKNGYTSNPVKIKKT